MKPFRKDAQFILMFFIFLTVFTIYSNLGIEPENTSSKTLQHHQQDILIVKPRSNRTPASISESTGPMLNKEFFCRPGTKVTQEKVGKSLVMISFKMCPKPKLISNVTIENQSNGFKAQIFKVENDKFKTDYIQLNNGVNRLKLEVVLKDGQKLEESLEILSGS